MEKLFISVLNMSFTASYAILLVILVRLLLKKAPKFISYILWSVVAFLLIIPFSFESMFSLIPRNINIISNSYDVLNQQNLQVNTEIETIDSSISNLLFENIIKSDTNPLQIYIKIGAYIWILGIIALLIYSIVSILILKNKLKNAQLIEENVYQVENLKTPFVFGLIRPKIYLPAGLSKEEQSYILIHEKIHIQRKDYIIKILAFLILSIHWFNPLVWIAFKLMSTDRKHILNGSPLAFGEGNVKGRIKNVLNYKKQSSLIMSFSIISLVIITAGLLANPKSLVSFNGSFYQVKEILYQVPMDSSNDLNIESKYNISSDYVFYSKQLTDEDWIMHGKLYSYKINRQKLYTLFDSPSNNIYEIINQSKFIYRTDINEDNRTFYLVIQLKNGDVLLALVYDNEENSYIRWLVRLEKLNDTNSEEINQDEQDIQIMVEAFGKTLKEVLLSAPDDIVAANIKEKYGIYITSELLQKWQDNPQSAPGRMVSSPWPERIDLIKIENTDKNQYTVYGEIIEVTSAEQVAAKRPITIVVEKINDSWLISDVTLGKYYIIEKINQEDDELNNFATGLFNTVLDITTQEEFAILNFYLQNISDETINFYFNSGQKFDILITDNNGIEVYRWSNDKFFTQAIINVELEKNEKLSFSEVWDYKDNEGNRVLPGKYTVKVKILARLENNKIINPDELTTVKDIEVK
ncbi:M56 family metallopeptidase [Defluviitalea phaphyphila]|uniref:M56 family metallopeptidase n=1 Tax=Defluviitalea phaphyphila TaxID=1473580 RepID=UPI000730A215|nr:M56 family metallopeptidase [Defluviitalea phaphyphila]